MNLPIYGQRDSRWSNILLGFNTSPPYTIGNYGCLISCFAMYLKALGRDETPATVNEKVKAVNGFVSGGNLVWSAIEQVYGIKCMYQSPYYDGPLTVQGKAKMKALLDEKHPLITHVDFDPNDPDDDMHWILVTGYSGDIFYCNDPWTGTNVPVDVYGGSIERAVIEFRAYDPVITGETATTDTCQVELDKARIARDSHWNELMFLFSGIGCTGDYSHKVAEERLKTISNFEDQIRADEKAIKAAQSQAEELRLKLDEQRGLNTTLQQKFEEYVKDNNMKITEFQGEIQKLTVNNTDLVKQVEVLKKQVESTPSLPNEFIERNKYIILGSIVVAIVLSTIISNLLK